MMTPWVDSHDRIHSVVALYVRSWCLGCFFDEEGECEWLTKGKFNATLIKYTRQACICFFHVSSSLSLLCLHPHLWSDYDYSDSRQWLFSAEKDEASEKRRHHHHLTNKGKLYSLAALYLCCPTVFMLSSRSKCCSLLYTSYSEKELEYQMLTLTAYFQMNHLDSLEISRLFSFQHDFLVLSVSFLVYQTECGAASSQLFVSHDDNDCFCSLFWVILSLYIRKKEGWWWRDRQERNCFKMRRIYYSGVGNVTDKSTFLQHRNNISIFYLSCLSKKDSIFSSKCFMNHGLWVASCPSNESSLCWKDAQKGQRYAVGYANTLLMILCVMRDLQFEWETAVRNC